jgi:hypothetical protein
MEVRDWLHALAAFHSLSIEEEAGWASEPVWIFWRSEKSLVSATE